MAGFTPQPDEGYSEHPLTAFSAPVPFSLKSREDALTALGSSRSRDEFPPWLIQHLSGLSITRKTELAMALLHDLPTSVISQIVGNLHPRLYIDFVRYLPPEVCLKVLEYLDPVSLINVARCCRAWYDLALDRKLWEQLYYLEGWKALPAEIVAAEREINKPSSSAHGALQRPQFGDKGHAHKKRALSLSPTLGADTDTVMVDAGTGVGQEPTNMTLEQISIFGGPRNPAPKSGMPQQMVDLDTPNPMTRSTSMGKAMNKGKGRALSPGLRGPTPTKPSFLETVMDTPRLPKSTLWTWDGSSTQYRINWKYLYTMRRRLESNWERGKYVNFQFPHPAYPEEGHGECVYSLQHNSQYLVSGSRDRTLKVWDMKSRRCLRTLAKHRGSVLCLQFDSSPEEDLIVSGSSDSDVIIWRFSTGEPIQILKNAHRESVLNVRFDQRILVTCSKDKTIKVFNRKPLRHGDLGYQEVDPVPRNVKDYGYNLPMTPDDFPVVPAWTMIGCLEGHGAAVNAVQIHDREVVSASGDRYIKVWDWPTQVCTRTIVGHHKGIACVQYDGRRIVSGSSDNEIKVFDRQTGLEVATLRAHSSLVRTVQAGFGDLPYSVEDDAAEAKKVDQEYFKAVEMGLIDERERPRSGRRPANAGSRRPEDICAYGAKLPPGGGGGKYGRIVSGSYDASIIIWRRDKEGVWKDQHHFKQETAAVAALQHDRAQSSVPLHPSVQNLVSREALRAMRTAASGPFATAPVAAGTPTTAPATASRLGTASASPGPSAIGQTLPPLSTLTTDLGQADAAPGMPQQLCQVIDSVVQGGQHALAQALAAYPQILSHRSYVEACIDRQQNPVLRSQLRQTYSSALMRAQFEQARQRREALRNQEDAASGSSTAGQASMEGIAGSQPTPAQLAAASANQAHAQAPPQGASMHQVPHPVPAVVPAAAASAAGGFTVPASVAGPAVAGSGADHGLNPPPVPPPPSPLGQPQAQAQAQQQPHIAQAPAQFEVVDPANPARVFKLQYDARRIICCSQRSVIVGWDFCNGDPELEEASRFFGSVD
ncbi:WD40 repeat-like protein [Parathielavia appendiculata]|uniref:WD40 repeat-like protein n=1 Tax=Parathielavia appendiculata TaxID=2587402 RepID=A0AAN6TTW5_9PEZI|nr:WD40 repeat-like protein [Parathielavia appendiculata]